MCDGILKSKILYICTWSTVSERAHHYIELRRRSVLLNGGRRWDVFDCLPYINSRSLSTFGDIHRTALSVCLSVSLSLSLCVCVVGRLIIRPAYTDNFGLSVSWSAKTSSLWPQIPEESLCSILLTTGHCWKSLFSDWLNYWLIDWLIFCTTFLNVNFFVIDDKSSWNSTSLKY